MRGETAFDPRADLIIVEGLVQGPRGVLPVRLAVDTGSTATMLIPDVIDAIGYSARDGRAITTVTTAIGKEHGYVIRIARFEALGFAERDFVVHVFDLAVRHEIDGLIGLNFLERFNYEVRSAEGRMLVERVAMP